MDSRALTFFPLPLVLAGERRAGLRFSWPGRCNKCDRQCERATLMNLAVCAYGVNYVRLDRDLLVFGFLVKGATSSSAHKKMLRRYPAWVIEGSEIEGITRMYTSTVEAITADLDRQKQQIIDEYKRTRRYERDFLAG
jgi:hypothetical protein